MARRFITSPGGNSITTPIRRNVSRLRPTLGPPGTGARSGSARRGHRLQPRALCLACRAGRTSPLRHHRCRHLHHHLLPPPPSSVPVLRNSPPPVRPATPSSLVQAHARNLTTLYQARRFAPRPCRQAHRGQWARRLCAPCQRAEPAGLVADAAPVAGALDSSRPAMTGAVPFSWIRADVPRDAREGLVPGMARVDSRLGDFLCHTAPGALRDVVSRLAGCLVESGRRDRRGIAAAGGSCRRANARAGIATAASARNSSTDRPAAERPSCGRAADARFAMARPRRSACHPRDLGWS